MCRILTADPVKCLFSQKSRQSLSFSKTEPCLAYDSVRQFVYLIGGLSDCSVSRHNLSTDTWEHGHSKLNEPRWFASACYLNDAIYVVGGYNTMGSIEKLDCSAAVEEDQPVWLTLEVPSMVLTPLQRPVVAVLNKYEIVVTGGYGFDYKLKSDIAILNTRNDRVRKVTKGHHSLQCYGS